MDINDIRSLTTLVSFVLFVVLVARVWQRKRRSTYDEAAQLPFADDAPAHTNPEGNP
jgi:cytochrome c oxidase cbb3-type subunit 4